jgi:hypothetical protein
MGREGKSYLVVFLDSNDKNIINYFNLIFHLYIHLNIIKHLLCVSYHGEVAG